MIHSISCFGGGGVVRGVIVLGMRSMSVVVEGEAD